MAASLIDIIDALDLEALTQALSDVGDRNKEKPEILIRFENAFRSPMEKIKDWSTPKDFQKKLILLLNYYNTPLTQNIYSTLQDLGTTHHLAQIVLNKISAQPEGKMKKLLLQGAISRAFTPDQKESAEQNHTAEVAVLDEQYLPLISTNIITKLNFLHDAVLDIATNDLISLKTKIENLVSLYETYTAELKSETDLFLSPAKKSFHNAFSDKIEDADKVFFEKHLFEQLVDAYLNMCFQYINTKAKYAIDPFKHNEILKFSIDSMLNILQTAHSGNAQEKIIAKIIEKLNVDTSIELDALGQANLELEQDLRKNVEALWKQVNGKKEYNPIKNLLEKKLRAGQNAGSRIEAIDAVTTKIAKNEKRYSDLKPFVKNAALTIDQMKENKEKLKSTLDAAEQLSLLLKTGDSVSKAVSSENQTMPEKGAGRMRIGRKEPPSIADSFSSASIHSAPAEQGRPSHFGVHRTASSSPSPSTHSAPAGNVLSSQHRNHKRSTQRVGSNSNPPPLVSFFSRTSTKDPRQDTSHSDSSKANPHK